MRWDDIPLDVQIELSNPFFVGKTHGKKSTSQAGCRGPLCQKAERDAARAHYARTRGGRVQRRRRWVSDLRDEQLTEIQEWHTAQVNTLKRAG